ncbi:hypothetical protein RCZ01_19700 [Capnocytophaga felis]|uniref:Uncharacterized protein n=2 Tax=Capnocytophaga felis TaxID=2267611 RepID=A0A5M4BAQ0_9FLAO|nr:hypothetical protein RCZ01_19700 [Capnocytophaga felis]GET48770.1 hypothetical protein RCZ02_16010 [Capnocytophaga felis]
MENKMTKSKKLWLYFIITMAVYLLMVFVTIPTLNRLANGLDIIDVLPFYDGEYVVRLLEYLESEGRHYYLYRQIPLDMLYPLLYAFTYWKILSHFIDKLNLKRIKWVVFFPIVAAVFDYLENIGIGISLYHFPSLSDTLLSVLPFFSLLKTLFVVLYLLAFFGLGIMVLVRRKKL